MEKIDGEMFLERLNRLIPPTGLGLHGTTPDGAYRITHQGLNSNLTFYHERIRHRRNHYFVLWPDTRLINLKLLEDVLNRTFVPAYEKSKDPYLMLFYANADNMHPDDLEMNNQIQLLNGEPLYFSDGWNIRRERIIGGFPFPINNDGYMDKPKTLTKIVDFLKQRMSVGPSPHGIIEQLPSKAQLFSFSRSQSPAQE